MSFVDSVPEAEESVTAVMRRYPQQALPLESMLDDLNASVVDDKLKPKLRFVSKLMKTPSRMVQSDVDAIFA